MEKNNKQNIIIVLLLINLIGVFFVMKGSNEEIRNEVYYLSHNVEQINNQLNNLENSLRNEIVETQEQALNYVSSFNYSYNALNKEALTMNTEISVELKESHVGSEVFLVAKDEDGTSHKILLSQSEGLKYSASVDLLLDKNYRFNIIEEFEGNMKQLNYEEYNVALKNDYYERRVVMESSSSGADNKSVYFSQEFSVNNFGIDDFEVKDMSFVLSKDGEIIYNEKATDGLFNMKDLSQEQRLKYAAGELLVEQPNSLGSSSQTESVTSEEMKESGAQEVVIDDNKKDTFIFQKVFVYDDYSDYDFDQDDRFESYMVVEFMDGSKMEVGR